VSDALVGYARKFRAKGLEGRAFERPALVVIDLITFS
jgi:hypothetical protein